MNKHNNDNPKEPPSCNKWECYRGLVKAEYEQVWKDFHHRNLMEGTWMTIFFAVTGALLTLLFTVIKDPTLSPYTGLLLSFVGIIFSIGIMTLMLGERRPWFVDIECIKKIETEARSLTPPVPVIGRINFFEQLLKGKKIKYDNLNGPTKTKFWGEAFEVMFIVMGVIIIIWNIVYIIYVIPLISSLFSWNQNNWIGWVLLIITSVIIIFELVFVYYCIYKKYIKNCETLARA